MLLVKYLPEVETLTADLTQKSCKWTPQRQNQGFYEGKDEDSSRKLKPKNRFPQAELRSNKRDCSDTWQLLYPTRQKETNT